MDEGEISNEELQKSTQERLDWREQRDNLVKILQADSEAAMDEAHTLLAKIESCVSKKVFIEIVTMAVMKASLKVEDLASPKFDDSPHLVTDMADTVGTRLFPSQLPWGTNTEDDKLNARQMNTFDKLILKYVDNMEERELICLFAIKNFVVKEAELELAVLTESFRHLYDDSIISLGAFKKWRDDTSIEPLGSDGRLLATKALEAFYAFLAEADDEDSKGHLVTGGSPKEEGEISDEELQTSTPQKLSSADQKAKEEGKISDEERQTSTPQKLSSTDQNLEEGEIVDETVQKFAPQKLSSADQALIKYIKDILDSLTPLNIELKMLKLKALQIRKIDVLQELVNLLLEKAFDEPQLIAQLVLRLHTRYMIEGSPLCRTIRKLLLEQILEKIKTDGLGCANIEIDGTPNPPNEENEETFDEGKKRKLWRKYMGLFRFLAELYKYDLAKVMTISDCITYLLSQEPLEAEEPLECLCLLLSSIGEKLERELAKEEFNELFTKIEHKTQDSKVSYMVKNMLQEVVALKQMKWLKIRDILNGLTHNNVFELARKIILHPINKEELSQELVNQIFEMSIDEPGIIVKLCVRLRVEWAAKSINERHQARKRTPSHENSKFRERFINKCQQCIENYNNNELNIANKENKKDLRLMLEENKKFLGLVKFMGKLYNRDLASSKTMCDCITILLSQETEGPLKCLCFLLTDIGEKLERELTKKEFNEFFAKLTRKSQDPKVSSGLQNLLKDVTKLRQKRWRKPQGPGKLTNWLDDKNVEREAAFESPMLNNPMHHGFRGRRMPRGMRRPGYRRGNPINRSARNPRWQISGNKYRTSSSSYTNTIEASRHFTQQSRSDARDAGISLGGSGAFSQWTSRSLDYSSSRGGMGLGVSGSRMSAREQLEAARERNNSKRQRDSSPSFRRNSRPRYMPVGHRSASSKDAAPPSSAFMNFADILNFSRPS